VKPIFMWWDSNFSKQFQEQLSNALFEILRLREDFSDRFNIRILGNFLSNESINENADWYFDSSYNSQRNQVNASSVLNKCAQNYMLRQTPQMHVIGTSHDLWNGEQDNGYVFGLTTPGFGTIVSCNKMSKYGSDASLVYLTLALHESAHLFKAPDAARRRDLDNALGPHCNLKDCALCQVNVGRRPNALEAARRVLERHQRTGSWFCSECTTDIVMGKRKLL
jgi:hypothetical protein